MLSDRQEAGSVGRVTDDIAADLAPRASCALPYGRGDELFDFGQWPFSGRGLAGCC